MGVNLFTSYYDDPDRIRDRELKECLRRNASRSELTAVHLIAEKPVTGPTLAKVRAVAADRRPTFNDFFALVNRTSGEDDVNIVANSDIYLDDEAIRLSRRYLPSDECWALTRWDVIDSGGGCRYFGSRVSQDTWIFRGRVRPVDAPFFMGRVACDNRLAFLLQEAGYKLRNPCRDVKTYHLHESNVRRYGTDEKDAVPGPYLDVEPEDLGRPRWLFAAKQVCRWAKQQTRRASC